MTLFYAHVCYVISSAVASADTEGFLSCTEFARFWITWYNGLIEVGRGAEVGAQVGRGGGRNFATDVIAVLNHVVLRIVFHLYCVSCML